MKLTANGLQKHSSRNSRTNIFRHGTLQLINRQVGKITKYSKTLLPEISILSSYLRKIADCLRLFEHDIITSLSKLEDGQVHL